MTTEEKAKAYDRLIVKLQAARNIDPDERFKCVIEEIVPELAESEDERIRKWLVAELHHEHDMVETGIIHPEYADKRREMLEKCIAYLEKQKEQKPAEWGKGSVAAVYEAIRQVCNTDSPKEFAGMNQTVFNVARRAIELCSSNQPHWKPSEEQMNFLAATIDEFAINNREAARKCMQSLYDDLKKLTEE